MQDRIAHYRIEGLVGEGAFAWVYRAFDGRLERHVALKVLKPFWMSDPKAVARFQHEAKMMARLHHPHIVVIHEVGEEEGQVYLAEHLVEGDSLAVRLQRGALPWDEAMRILKALASALDYAHSQGIVHRDIKPANILLAEDGGVYLSDFGLVRAAEGSVSVSSSTGGIVGTPPYMAPEQWRGEEVTGATDVYALSCVVVEMLTGKVLFQGPTPAAVMTKHMVDGPTLPEHWPRGVPTGVERVLRRGLARDAAERFASAAELVTGLSAPSVTAQKEDPATSAVTDESERAQAPGSRPLRWALAAIGLMAVGAVAALLVSGIVGPPAKPTSSVAAVTVATRTGTVAPTSTPTVPTSTAAATPTATPMPPSPSATFMPAIPTPAWTAIPTPTHTGTHAIPTPAWTTVRTPTHTTTKAIPTPAWTDIPEPTHTGTPAIPTPAWTNTHAATTPALSALTPTAQGDMPKIFLADPTDGFDLSSDRVEFRWLWRQDCEPPPEGYGFEVRVWPHNPAAVPLGAMDAARDQPGITCHRDTGIRSYTVGNIKLTPGVAGAEAGSFRWDVALVQLHPYRVIARSYSSHRFNIPASGPEGGGGGPGGGIIK